MKTFNIIKKYFLLVLTAVITFGCIDNVPDIEELPSPDINFNYHVIDNTYQLDYYTGANIEFTNNSALSGTATWDFGDGSAPITGDVVTHKYNTHGTYQVKLTIDGKSNSKPILIRDIVPIMIVAPIEGGICEVLTTPISILTELPNPEGLSEEYLWIFPEGTMDEEGNVVSTSSEKDPGKLKFSHVGSQTVRLQVKLGGRTLEEGRVNVQVGYNEEVPTLYYAIKGGNVMALKLVKNAPTGMKISPFDMAISSGTRPLNILFNDASLYLLDCGRQFTWVDPRDGLGDGRITVMAKDGSRMETMLTNAGGDAFMDPYYGYIESGYLYFSDRLTGINRIELKERNRVFSAADFPFYIRGDHLGYYGKGMGFASLNAGFTKVKDTWYWSKTYSGTGIYRFKDSDILKAYNNGVAPAPESGNVLSGVNIKSVLWDNKNSVVYFTIFGSGRDGLYRCTVEQLNSIGPVSESSIAPFRLKLYNPINGKTVTPITEPGKGEGAEGEYIGICQLTLDDATGDVYFGLRSGDPEVKSGLMRYNATSKIIEHVIEGVEVYGVAVNNAKSKLF